MRLLRALPLATLICLPLLASADEAKFAKGMEAYEAGQFEQAADIWKSLADQGDAKAAFNMGGLYLEGKGELENDRPKQLNRRVEIKVVTKELKD